VKIITGNDLKSGAVTWWDGKGWSLSVNDAVEVGADAAAIIAEEEATRRVNGAYTIEADQTEEGIRPAHIKGASAPWAPRCALTCRLTLPPRLIGCCNVRYDQYDQAMVDARVAEFRDQTRRRIEGTLSEEKFRPLRLQNGLYLQLHAYMLRVAVPYGTLSSRR
jgi:hypothetical protein